MQQTPPMQPTGDPRVLRRVAAIDVGSNTVRAIAACLLSDRVLVPFRCGDTMAALGRGLSSTRRISPQAIEDTAEFVAGFLRDCGHLDSIYCVGTAAARDAANTHELRHALSQRAGVQLEVISPRVEAHLSFVGAIAVLQGSVEGTPVVADVGGRSTELATRRARSFRSASVPIGARALTEAFLASDPPSRSEVTAARRAARSALADALELLKDAGTLVAAGGTACSAALLAGDRWSMSLPYLQLLRRRLCKLELRERCELMAFDPPRAEIICGGLIILEILAAHSPRQGLRISSGGVREGLLIRRTRAKGIAMSTPRAETGDPT